MKLIPAVIITLIVIALFAFNACKSTDASTSKESKDIAKVEVKEDFKLYIERTPCYGSCPTFKLTVDAKGNVDYEGIRFVDNIGKYTKSLSKKKVQELVYTIETGDFWSFKDKYDGQVTDLPAVITECTHDGKTKKVYNRYEAPKGLRDLQQRLEAIIGGEGYKEVKSKEE